MGYGILLKPMVQTAAVGAPGDGIHLKIQATKLIGAIHLGLLLEGRDPGCHSDEVLKRRVT
jgi:hypothetical protein